jgi:hypothetical protein
LTFLHLPGATHFTDGGLASFRNCKRLQTVHLHSTPITDAALKHLHQCTDLKTVGVTKTKVTVAGIARLKSALPNCAVRSDYTDEEINAAMDNAKDL